MRYSPKMQGILAVAETIPSYCGSRSPTLRLVHIIKLPVIMEDEGRCAPRKLHDDLDEFGRDDITGLGRWMDIYDFTDGCNGRS
jgi:hypothetical protein